MRRFILMTEQRAFVVAWTAWLQYVAKHRVWDRKRKQRKSTVNMLNIGFTRAPGSRTVEELEQMSDWAKYAGPAIFKKLTKSEINDICQCMVW
jgi:hypothetical protein